MAKAEMTVTIDALNIPKVVRVIKAAEKLRIAVRAYGLAKLRCEPIMRDGDPLVTEWMRVVEAHDALVEADLPTADEVRGILKGEADSASDLGEQGTPIG